MPLQLPTEVLEDGDRPVDAAWLRTVLQKSDHGKISRLLHLLHQEYWVDSVKDLEPLKGHPVSAVCIYCTVHMH